jgi:hypothetical protein
MIAKRLLISTSLERGYADAVPLGGLSRSRARAERKLYVPRQRNFFSQEICNL